MLDFPTKLYVENTARCNLSCTMCMLNDMPEPTGLMPLSTFEMLVTSLKRLPTMPEIHFAGYGEPTSHPAFLQMVEVAKNAGATVAVTTNGTLLDYEMARELVRLGLDRLVVSIDGTSPENYADIRLGSMLPEVIENMRGLRRAKIYLKGKDAPPHVGIAFVAMKRNIHELPELHLLAARIGATEVIVSNMVAYTPEMEAEILYERSISTRHRTRSDHRIDISLPKMDINPQTAASLMGTFDKRWSIGYLDAPIDARDNYCRFIEDGYSVIRWDGAVSPCLDLMHEHTEWLHGRPRHIQHYGLGNVKDTPFDEIWSSTEYVEYRQRVSAWEYSPCAYCAGCNYFSENQEDCTEISPAPVCGGCLWSQGLIQCP